MTINNRAILSDIWFHWRRATRDTITSGCSVAANSIWVWHGLGHCNSSWQNTFIFEINVEHLALSLSPSISHRREMWNARVVKCFCLSPWVCVYGNSMVIHNNNVKMSQSQSVCCGIWFGVFLSPPSMIFNESFKSIRLFAAYGIQNEKRINLFQTKTDMSIYQFEKFFFFICSCGRCFV